MLRVRRLVGSGGIVTATLASFLGLLIQPQVAALYHVHAGGEHVHVHARLLTAPTAAHQHGHPHAHRHYRHRHASHAHAQHARHHGSSVHHRKTPVFRHAHTPHRGHWHTTLALHLAGLPPAAPILTPLHTASLSQAVTDSYIFSSIPTHRSRAPPVPS